MSDVNQAGQENEQVSGQDDESFDAAFDAFLASSLGGDDFVEDDDQGDDSQPGNESTPAAAGEESTPGETPDVLNTDPAGDATPNAQPNAGPNGTPAEQQDPAISPADLAAVLGLTEDPAPAPAPGATAQPSAAAEPTPSSDPKDEAPYAPFQPNFKLPPAMTSALFEAEDTETRHQALVSLLAAFGNTILQAADQRIKEHHAPRIQETTAGAIQQATVRNAIQQDFYGTYPELRPYEKAVRAAFGVVSKKHTGKPYMPEHRDEIAKLTKAALRASGIQLESPAAPAAAAPAKPAAPQPQKKKATGTAFEAGGARPAGFGAPGNSGNDPTSLVEELSQF